MRNIYGLAFASALALVPALAFAKCPVGQNAMTQPSCEMGHVTLPSAFPAPRAICFQIMETGHIYAIDDSAPGARALEFGLTLLGNGPGSFISASTTALCGPPVQDASGNWIAAKLLEGIAAE